MRKGKPKQNPEGGITLIALVITIIILVIISAIVIRTVTGDNNLISTTIGAADNYKISEYKELIENEVVGTVMANMIKGKGTTLEEIAEAIQKNVDGVISAIVNADETLTNKDILVTTKEGYIFQIIYDDLYGTYKIEFLGKGDKNDVLNKMINLVAVYNKYTKAIEAKATTSTGRIEKIEILLGDELIAETAESSIVAKVTKPGNYTAKAIGSEGRIRYAWVRVESLNGGLEAPSIYPSSGEAGDEGWYTGELKIMIRTDNEKVTKIKYIVKDKNSITEVGEESWQETTEKEIEIPISEIRKNNDTSICRR